MLGLESPEYDFQESNTPFVDEKTDKTGLWYPLQAFSPF